MGQRRTLPGLRMLITGASQGIGRALAVDAAKRGVKVLAAARSAPLLEELANEIREKGGTIETIVADVSSAEDRQKMYDAAQQKFGGLDVLVNNAGIGATGHFAEATADRLRSIMEVNFFGLTETTRLFLPMLKQGKTPALVNISSILGKRALPSRSEYSASKFAVQGFSEAIRPELAKDGIDVLVICPGLTQTNFSKNMLERNAKMSLDHQRGMTSEQVAEATLYAIERGKDEVWLTFKGKLLLWVNRFFPKLVDFVIRRIVQKRFAEEATPSTQPSQPASTTAH